MANCLKGRQVERPSQSSIAIGSGPPKQLVAQFICAALQIGKVPLNTEALYRNALAVVL